MKRSPINTKLYELGFKREGGNRMHLQKPGFDMNLYTKGNDKYRMNIRTMNGDLIAVDYSQITENNISDVIDDSMRILNEKFPNVINVVTNDQHKVKTITGPKPKPVPVPAKASIVTKNEPIIEPFGAEPLPIQPEFNTIDYERVINLRAPNPEDGPNYDVMFVTPDDYAPYEPIFEQYSADPADTVDTALSQKVEERVFQPMNSYTNFPLRGSNNPSIEGFFDRRESLAPENVDMELLSEARDAEGQKYVIEKEEKFGTDKTGILSTIKNVPPAIPITLVAVGLGFVAHQLFFKNRF